MRNPQAPRQPRLNNQFNNPKVNLFDPNLNQNQQQFQNGQNQMLNTPIDPTQAFAMNGVTPPSQVPFQEQNQGQGQMGLMGAGMGSPFTSPFASMQPPTPDPTLSLNSYQSFGQEPFGQQIAPPVQAPIGIPNPLGENPYGLGNGFDPNIANAMGGLNPMQQGLQPQVQPPALTPSLPQGFGQNNVNANNRLQNTMRIKNNGLGGMGRGRNQGMFGNSPIQTLPFDPNAPQQISDGVYRGEPMQTDLPTDWIKAQGGKGSGMGMFGGQPPMQPQVQPFTPSPIQAGQPQPVVPNPMQPSPIQQPLQPSVLPNQFGFGGARGMQDNRQQQLEMMKSRLAMGNPNMNTQFQQMAENPADLNTQLQTMLQQLQGMKQSQYGNMLGRFGQR